MGKSSWTGRKTGWELVHQTTPKIENNYCFIRKRKINSKSTGQKVQQTTGREIMIIRKKIVPFRSNTTSFHFLRNLYQKVVSACITLVEIFQIFSFIKFFGIYSIKCLYQRVCTLVSWHHFGRDICKSLFKRKHFFYSCYFYF